MFSENHNNMASVKFTAILFIYVTYATFTTCVDGVATDDLDADQEAGNRISPRHVPPKTCCVTYNVKEYHVHDKDKAKSTRWNANAEAVRRERLKWLRRVEKLQTQLIVKKQKKVTQLNRQRKQLQNNAGSGGNFSNTSHGNNKATNTAFAEATNKELQMIKSELRTSAFRHTQLYRAYRRLTSNNYQLSKQFSNFKKEAHTKFTKFQENLDSLRTRMDNETAVLRNMLSEFTRKVACPNGKCPEGFNIDAIKPDKSWKPKESKENDAEFIVLIHNEEQLEFLKARGKSTDLPEVSDLPHLGRITVSKDDAQFIQMELSAQNMPFWIGNLTQSLKRKPEDDLTTRKDEELLKQGIYNFRRYLNLNQVYHYLVQKKYNCGRYCELVHIGKSYEGKNLLVVKVSEPSARNVRKKAIWIDGGTHAREWISVSTALFILDKLLNIEDEESALMRDMYDWFIMPISNPDGYSYTFEKDRMWRKTRMPNENSACIGVDPNRNYAFKWGESGRTDDPCEETYGGTEPFSQPETRSISNYIMSRNGTWQAFLTLHSFSQLWLAPWGYTTAKPENYDKMEIVGQRAINALYRVNGTRYKLGSASKLMYDSSGTARDWATGHAHIPYVYTVELRDKGQYGFLLPATEIVGTGSETWAAVVEMSKAIEDIERPKKRG